jgi:phage/plasmid-like protein (TIGR03299 family)
MLRCISNLARFLMAHELEINANGQANMFSVGSKPPWHGLGVILDKPPTVEEAITCAGLDWQVRLQPLHMKYDGEDLPVPGYATVRDTDKKVLGVVGPTYKPLQNKDAFRFFQPFLDAKEASIETAGSLRGGTRVWVLAKVTQSPIEIVPGDAVENFILLSNAHDGSMAVRVGFTGVRVVCSNTMAAAHGDKASKLLRVRHSAKAAQTLDEVREIMDVGRQEFVAHAEKFRVLARKGVSVADLKNYVRKVFEPKVTLIGAETEEAENKSERLLAKITPLFEHGRGNDLPGVAGTAWGALNAVSEFLTHERGNSDDNRLNSLWFGDSAEINSRALKLALAMG